MFIVPNPSFNYFVCRLLMLAGESENAYRYEESQFVIGLSDNTEVYVKADGTVK
jgi:hypothetical protein